MPGHPDADADGYVSIPAHQRGGRYGRPHKRQSKLSGECIGHLGGKDMIQKSIDLLR